MKKAIPDFYLVVLTLVCVSCAAIAVIWHDALNASLRHVLLLSLFLSPALVGFGVWKFFRKEGSIYHLVCIAGGVASLLILFWPVLEFYRKH
jgi:hypothetical protein